MNVAEKLPKFPKPDEWQPIVIPPIKGEVAVKIQLPDEALVLMRDLHADRSAIGWGGAILVACAVALVFHRVASGRKS